MITIIEAQCRGCGHCADVCPRRVVLVEPRENGEKRARVEHSRTALCIDCGHCAAICPEDAIRVDGLPAEEWPALEGENASPEALGALLASRRAIRRYKKDKPVPRDLIEKIVEAARLAPPAAGRGTTSVYVLDQEERIRAFMELVYAKFEALEAVLRSPIKRFFAKRVMSKHQYERLTGFAMPAVRWYVKWHREEGRDEVRRDAPAILLFSSPASDPGLEENGLIAAYHANLMAHALGLGGIINGLIPPVCNRSAEIRAFLGLANDEQVTAAFTFGYPRFRYKRAIPRDLARVRYLD